MFFVLTLTAYVLATFFAVLKGIACVQASLTYKRGTNTATRFVRDIATNRVYRQAVTMGSIQLIIALFSAFALNKGIKLYFLFPLPGLVIIALSFIMQAVRNSNEQRVKDARVVTKGAMDVADAAAPALGAVAAGATMMATGGVSGLVMAAGAAGATIGVAKSAGTASQMMTDVQSLDVDSEREFSELTKVSNMVNGKIIESAIDLLGSLSPSDFISGANRMGLTGETVEEVADSALQSKPMLMLLEERGQEPTRANIIPVVKETLQASGLVANGG